MEKNYSEIFVKYVKATANGEYVGLDIGVCEH